MDNSRTGSNISVTDAISATLQNTSTCPTYLHILDQQCSKQEGTGRSGLLLLVNFLFNEKIFLQKSQKTSIYLIGQKSHISKC